MKSRRIARLFAVAALALVIGGSWVPSARADFFHFETAAGATAGGEPIAAEADFTTTADTVTSELRNLQANPTSDIQALSGLSFNVISGQTAGTLSGDFQGFHAYLRQVEKMSRIIRVNQMKLEKIANRDGDMQATVTMSIFFESDGSGMRYAGAN